MYRRHIQNCELRTEISVICDFFCVFGTRLSTWCKAVEMMLSLLPLVISKAVEKTIKIHFLTEQLSGEPKNLSPEPKGSKRALYQKVAVKKFRGVHNPLFEGKRNE